MISAAFLFATSVYAQTDATSAAQCVAPMFPQTADLSVSRASAVPEIIARQIRADAEDYSELLGDVELRRADQSLFTPRLKHFFEQDVVMASGPVRYQDRALQLEAQSLRFNLQTDLGTAQDTHFLMPGRRGNGHADSIIHRGDNTSSLTNLSYSTCPPENRDWVLLAEQMELDHDAGIGVAEDIQIRFKDIPIFYWPKISFPLDNQRKTGFLVPGLSYSSRDGLDIELPYYINIAANQDATIIPRFISDRGFMLGGQYRYLLNRHRGQLDFEYLPDDDERDSDRGRVQYEHRSQFSEYLGARVNLIHVSDDDYFVDFGNSLYDISRRILPSTAALVGAGELWEATAELNHYQNIDPLLAPSREPFNRLPRVQFSGMLPSENLFRWQLDSEYVVFAHDHVEAGQRLDLMPRAVMEFRRSAGFVKATAAFRHTQYFNETGPDQTRNIPIGSVDTGLYFDRVFERDGKRFLSTIEPRLHYLYVPYRDQSLLPRYDTRRLSFGVPQLFGLNRFAGADRVGDANQLAAAVTTRILDQETGHERFSATIGQIRYFEDRQVQLAGNRVDTEITSPWIAEVRYSPTERWLAAATLEQDPHTNRTEFGIFKLQYRFEEKLLNFAYRRRRGDLEQLDFSTIWPLSDKWKGVMRWNYSLRENRTLEALVGASYESCCWATRIVARRYIQENTDIEQEGLFVEFVFKGLGSVGRDPARLLRTSIAGFSDYQDRNQW